MGSFGRNMSHHHNIEIYNKIAIRGEIVISDPDGSNEQVFPMNSLLKNFCCWFNQAIHYINSTWYFGKNSLNADVNFINSGTHRIYDSTNTTYRYHAYNGIMIGTGSPSKTVDMYAMGTPITNTTITRAAPVVAVVEDNTAGAEKTYVNITRNITNASGGTINVTELAMTFYNASNAYTMLIYDQVSYAFANGATKSFQIRLIVDNTVLVRNLARFLSVKLWNLTTPIKRTNGTTANISTTLAFLSNLVENTTDNALLRGIVVGSSDTANAVDTYVLASQIDESTLFQKHVSFKSRPFLDGADYCFYVRRSFTNITQSPVTIKEIAFYLNNSTSGYMIYRVVVPDTTIPVAQTIEIQFTIRFVF
jgi:hypothetical protein